MQLGNLTRRRFALLAATAAIAAPIPRVYGQRRRSDRRPTAAELMEKIAAGSGVALPAGTVDGFKAGDPAAAVRGVAVTAMATIDVLRQAASAGLNLVVSLEPTFFGHGDAQLGLPPPRYGVRPVAVDDPVLLAKRAFIAAHEMVVYRLHDQWIGRREREHARALAAAMGWRRPIAGGESGVDYEIEPVRLADLVPQVRARLGSGGGLRAVGGRDTLVRRVSVMPGLQPLAALVTKLPSTDLILTGETRDWEGPEYIGDAATAGLGKSMVMVGRVVSEQPGMRACADWIGSMGHDLPVTAIAAGEPYWRPA